MYIFIDSRSLFLICISVWCLFIVQLLFLAWAQTIRRYFPLLIVICFTIIPRSFRTPFAFTTYWLSLLFSMHLEFNNGDDRIICVLRTDNRVISNIGYFIPSKILPTQTTVWSPVNWNLFEDSSHQRNYRWVKMCVWESRNESLVMWRECRSSVPEFIFSSLSIVIFFLFFALWRNSLNHHS